MKVRPLAIYLPQFHPIPENDAWWGPGFTEWTNVVKAKPKFRGHYQPHLPADLGFYDLRLVETMAAQAALARKYGIYGFCVYHYWFNGKLLLEKPLENVLRHPDVSFNYCMCWANENWTRRWDGMNESVLIRQTYSPEDDEKHWDYLRPFFADERYIKVDGRPLFVVYRQELIADIKKRTHVWRAYCRRIGIGEIYLVFIDKYTEQIDPQSLGFDASFEFQPNWRAIQRTSTSRIKNVLRKLHIPPPGRLQNRLVDYEKYVTRAAAASTPSFKRFPGVFPMWDNSARRSSNATIFYGSTPELYEDYLRQTLKHFTPFSAEENFLLLTAWNEWAEGNHLEPCQKWGHTYLEATRKALDDATGRLQYTGGP